MKKISLFAFVCTFCLTFCSCSKSNDDNENGGEVIDDKINVIDKIKDPYFKAHVVLYVQKGWYETENPEVLKPSEAAKIKEVSLSSTADRDKIQSLEGIEYFTGIEKLHLNRSPIALVDLSKSPKVTEINIYDCTAESMKIISPSVKKINAQSLKSNSLILETPSLTTYDGDDTKLTVLDVSACPKLETLRCGGSKIKSLDLSKNPELQVLSCGGSGNISSHILDISSNKKLHTLYAGMGNSPLRTLYVWWDGGEANVPSSFKVFFIEKPTNVVKK